MQTSNIFPGQFRLSRIQAINWGTFGGSIDIEVPREGFLITGGSGTGKSTLLDAMSAVLLPGDKLRFNAAAQANTPRGKGRTLVSYLRGAWGSREDHATGTVVTKTARPKATYTVVVLTYSDGVEKEYSLAALFYLKAHANSSGDVQRLYGVLEGPVAATDFAPYLSGGLDTRGIKKQFPQGKFNNSHSAFAATFRRRLGIPGAEAMELLHRTQSAKDLQSLDDLFRDYVLHKPDTYELADQAVEGFRELEIAYQKVQDTKAQIDALEPLVKLRQERDAAAATKEHAEALLRTMPKVVRQLRREDAEERIEELKVELSQAINAQRLAAERKESQQSLIETLRASLNEQIGSRIEVIDAELHHAHERLAMRTRTLADLSERILALNGKAPETLEDFEQLEATARQIRDEHDEQIKELDGRAEEVVEKRTQVQNELKAITDELESLARRQNNISARHIAMREHACAELGLQARDLPFAGELIDVTDPTWEPVIQRQLRGLATVMLVPRTVFDDVRRWANDNNLGLRLRMNAVDTHVEYAAPTTSGRSLVRKIEVVESPMRNWLNWELATRYDYQCVDTPGALDELKAHEKGVTLAGLVKLATNRHDTTTRWEKDDRFSLTDRRHWYLGSNNDAKVELLLTMQQGQRKQVEAHKRVIAEIAKTRKLRNLEFNWATSMTSLTYQDVDVAGAQATIDDLEAGRKALSSSPEAATLTAQLDAARAELKAAEREEQDATGRRSVAENNLQKQQDLLQELDEEDQADPIDTTDELLKEVRALLWEKNRRINLAVNEVQSDCQRSIKRADATLQRATNSIVSTLSAYINQWGSEAADLAADVNFLGDALTRLGQLKGERLGEFSNQFRDLINDMSTRALGQLAHAIRSAKDDIERRITPVNASLAQSEFNRGRYLQIDVRDARGDEAKTFLRDLDAAISGGLSTADDAQSMQRYQAINAIITRLSSAEYAEQRWQHTVLDTRRHVRFIGVESEQDGTIVNTYADSTTLSGGQAQKLVFFCLAAALRYQLADDGHTLPNYATVVLDEAFDRADPTFTRQTMDVFAQFGFHMILATPLKLIQVLGNYVGGSIVFDYKEEADENGNVRGVSRYSTIGITSHADA